MGAFKQAARRTITWIPKSRLLAACCRFYCEHCGGSSPTITSDPTANGELRFVREAAPHLDVVLDVGANVGDWTASVLELRPTATIHAFEPSTSAHHALLRRGFPDNVTVHKAALSSRTGTAPLHIFGEASGLNSLHNRFGLEDGYGIPPATQTEEAMLLTADEFCMSHGLQRVDLMKVDTEGHEVDVLQGSVQSLKSGIIRRVQFEYGGTYIDSRRFLKDAFDVFAGLDYVIFRIIPDGLIACPRYDQRIETFQYNNFVAIRSDLISESPSAGKALQQSQ